MVESATRYDNVWRMMDLGCLHKETCVCVCVCECVQIQRERHSKQWAQTHSISKNNVS